MKPKIWQFLVFSVVILTVGSFAFLFRENLDGPTLWNIPFIFWTSFIVSILIVLATYLGSIFFTHQESNKK